MNVATNEGKNAFESNINVSVYPIFGRMRNIIHMVDMLALQ